MILHLIRHPPPEIAAGVCYGQLDVAAQAVATAAARLQPLLPENAPVYSSPLRRCQALAEALHPAPQFDARLQEMHFGAWEGCPWDEISIDALDAWAADVAGFAPPGGESGRAVQARAVAFLTELLENPAPELVVVTHAGVMRALLAHWQGLPGERWLELRFDFAQVTSVELTGLNQARLLRVNA